MFSERYGLYLLGSKKGERQTGTYTTGASDVVGWVKCQPGIGKALSSNPKHCIKNLVLWCTHVSSIGEVETGAAVQDQGLCGEDLAGRSVC